MPEQLTLYTSSYSPFAQRVEIALKEVGVDATRFEVDLANKPEWYGLKVNPANKVPAITYGGPIVPADQPSEESTKLAESLILVEFIADLFPTCSTLLPSDPVLRAKARLFIDLVNTKLTPIGYALVIGGKAGAEEQKSFFGALEAVQSLLPTNKIYAVSDDFTIADVAIAPFLLQLHTALKYDKGAYKVGEGRKLYEAIFTSPRFLRLQKYLNDLLARKSVQETYSEDTIIQRLDSRFGATRAQ